MNKIIFMSHGYVFKAYKNAIYRNLVKDGIIAENWNETHTKLYTDPLWIDFQKYVKYIE